MMEYFNQDEAPTAGTLLAVKVHPDRPAVVVLAANE
jgi:hypothetical protein